MMPIGAYQTYSVSAPDATHWRLAGCSEVLCDAYVNGWRTVVPTNGPEAYYIRHDRTRRAQEVTAAGDAMATFLFEAGQNCFEQHRTPNGRPELYVVRRGDSRGNPTGERSVVQAPEWVDRFQEHQDKLETMKERG